MKPDDATIKARLEEVLQSIVCPVSGCWGLHGAHYEYYHDEGGECYVLEVWPVAFEDPSPEGGKARRESQVVTVPHGELDNVKGKPDRQLVDDYCYSFHNWR